MKTLYYIFAIFASASALAQTECTFEVKYSINAPSGMKMRSAPQVGADVVAYVMFDSIVEACTNQFAPLSITDNGKQIDGYWRKVKYKEKVGYMFDGYLTLIQPNVIPQTDSLVDADSTIAIDSISLGSDSTLSDSAFVGTTDELLEAGVGFDKYHGEEEFEELPEEPPFVWQRTKRDSIPSAGRLDPTQIRALASALRVVELPMDSLIAVLHELPTKGSQDSLIAWVNAGMPGGIPSQTVHETVATDAPDSNPTRTQEKQGPAPIRFQMATEAYNYCGDINALDPSMNWYGLFPDDLNDGYQMRRVDLEIVVSKNKLGNGPMEFDIRNSTGDYAHFLFAINRLIDTSTFYQLSPERFNRIPPTLYPGQQMEAFARYNRPSAANVFISATGSVVEVGACPVIEGYQIRINTQGPYGEIQQNLTPLFTSLGKCGLPEMYWFGDLNGDNYPELVYVSPEKNKNTFTLFVSNVNLPEGLYEVGSVWTLQSCQ